MTTEYKCKKFEEFIEVMETHFPDEFKTVDWNAVSHWKFLSPEFLRRYRKLLKWKVICTYQQLTKEQIAEFFDEVDFNVLLNTHGHIIPKDSNERNKVLAYILYLHKSMKAEEQKRKEKFTEQPKIKELVC